MLHDLGDPADDGVTVVVSPAPVVGVPLIEDFIQPLVGRSYAGSIFTDNEAWGLQQAGLQSFLPRLCTAAAAATDGTHSRRVVMLSGDVHYGYAARLRFSARAPHTAPGAPTALATTRVEGVAAQLVSSSLKNEEGKTRFLHSIGFEPVLDRLPERRLVGWRNEAGSSIQVGNELGLGWGGSGLRPWKVSGRPAVGEVTETRVVTSEPDIRAEISFVKHDEADPEVPRRDVTGAAPSRPPAPTPSRPWRSTSRLPATIRTTSVRGGRARRSWVASTSARSASSGVPTTASPSPRRSGGDSSAAPTARRRHR